MLGTPHCWTKPTFFWDLGGAHPWSSCPGLLCPFLVTSLVWLEKESTFKLHLPALLRSTQVNPDSFSKSRSKVSVFHFLLSWQGSATVKLPPSHPIAFSKHSPLAGKPSGIPTIKSVGSQWTQGWTQGWTWNGGPNHGKFDFYLQDDAEIICRHRICIESAYTHHPFGDEKFRIANFPIEDFR